MSVIPTTAAMTTVIVMSMVMMTMASGRGGTASMP